jgi:HEAT repeat protein
MTAVNKRLVAYHIARLQDKSPDIRLKAINELVLLADPEALEALKDVFKNDADIEIRKAAQEAGRLIFLKSKEQPQPGSGAE